MRPRRSISFLLGLWFAASPLALGDPVVPPLVGRQLDPQLRAAAEAAGVTLEGHAPASSAPASGDAVVLWIGVANGKRTEQWLVQLSRSAASSSLKLPDRKTTTYHLSWGREVVLESDWETLDVWIAGPATERTTGSASGVATRRTEIRVPGSFLRLGLDASARVSRQIGERTQAAQKAGTPIDLGAIFSLTNPVDPRVLPAARAAAEVIGFTPENERAWVGGMAAVSAFYESANNVPELKAIGLQVVKRPSAWKLLKAAAGAPVATAFNAGGVQETTPATLGLPPVATSCFRLPFHLALTGDPLLQGEMVVTSPVPPLDLNAGIIAMIVAHPDEPQRIAQLVLISSRHAHP